MDEQTVEQRRVYWATADVLAIGRDPKRLDQYLAVVRDVRGKLLRIGLAQTVAYLQQRGAERGPGAEHATILQQIDGWLVADECPVVWRNPSDNLEARLASCDVATYDLVLDETVEFVGWLEHRARVLRGAARQLEATTANGAEA